MLTDPPGYPALGLPSRLRAWSDYDHSGKKRASLPSFRRAEILLRSAAIDPRA